MAALNRALALEEMHDVAVMIGQDLELDVARLLDQTFDVERAVAERGRRLPPRLRDRAGQRRLIANRLHPDAAAAFRGLQQHGKADAPDRGRNRRVGLIRWRLAGHDRHAGALRQTPRRDLRAHAVDDVGRRTDERHARLLARGRQGRILRQKPVSRMHGLCAGRSRRTDDRFDRQIALGRRCGPDAYAVIGKRRVQRLRIGVGIDSDRLDAHLTARADHADGDLAAVGDQDFREHTESTTKITKKYEVAKSYG